jgi:hypothetical protein
LSRETERIPFANGDRSKPLRTGEATQEVVRSERETVIASGLVVVVALAVVASVSAL